MKAKGLAINALIAALYFVVTAFVAPFGFTMIQFRLSEAFNHLIVYNKRYFFGIVLGVFLANLFLSPAKVDIVFGVGHTIISLLITMYIARFVKNKLILMGINTAVFSFNMFIIAYMLKFFADAEEIFAFLWLILASEEFLTMGLSIFLIYFLNKRLHFEKIL